MRAKGLSLRSWKNVFDDLLMKIILASKNCLQNCGVVTGRFVNVLLWACAGTSLGANSHLPIWACHAKRLETMLHLCMRHEIQGMPSGSCACQAYLAVSNDSYHQHSHGKLVRVHLHETYFNNKKSNVGDTVKPFGFFHVGSHFICLTCLLTCWFCHVCPHMFACLCDYETAIKPSGLLVLQVLCYDRSCGVWFLTFQQCCQVGHEFERNVSNMSNAYLQLVFMVLCCMDMFMLFDTSEVYHSHEPGALQQTV